MNKAAIKPVPGLHQSLCHWGNRFGRDRPAEHAPHAGTHPPARPSQPASRQASYASRPALSTFMRAPSSTGAVTSQTNSCLIDPGISSQLVVIQLTESAVGARSASNLEVSEIFRANPEHPAKGDETACHLERNHLVNGVSCWSIPQFSFPKSSENAETRPAAEKTSYCETTDTDAFAEGFLSFSSLPE